MRGENGIQAAFPALVSVAFTVADRLGRPGHRPALVLDPGTIRSRLFAVPWRSDALSPGLSKLCDDWQITEILTHEEVI